MCGGSMRLKQSETVVRVLGNPKGTTLKTREWICADCDYFEDAEQEAT